MGSVGSKNLKQPLRRKKGNKTSNIIEDTTAIDDKYLSSNKLLPLTLISDDSCPHTPRIFSTTLVHVTENLQQFQQTNNPYINYYGDKLENEREEDDFDQEQINYTAMSLGMDREEFLFNLLYFGNNGEMINFNSAISNAREETVALHSENNTPYKLRPAAKSIIDSLVSIPFVSLDSSEDQDCAVCKEEHEVGIDVIVLPDCSHCFHKDCLTRWLSLVRK